MCDAADSIRYGWHAFNTKSLLLADPTTQTARKTEDVDAGQPTDPKASWASSR